MIRSAALGSSRVLAAFFACLAWVAHAYGADAAGNYPNKPIRILVGFQPGGGSDLLARLMSQKLSGTGSSAHLGMELFNSMAGVQMVHVPYKGSGQALIDLLGGQISLTLASAISAAPHMKSGKLRALAVTTAKRSPLVPDLPSIAEAGVPGYEVAGWYGLVAPRGTSGAIVRKLNAEMVSILQAPEVEAHLANDGADTAPSTPQEFGATIENEVKKWTKVVTNAGIRLD